MLLPKKKLLQTEDGRTRVECRFANENLWLSQALIAELFQVTVPTVNEHLKGIYAEAELRPAATIRNFRIVRSRGQPAGDSRITTLNNGVNASIARAVASPACFAWRRTRAPGGSG